ncbi:VOC family protein [Nakamurella aerolata]|uniref:Glyoxalase n=1 Tax=Nakamurella aerolata TaxID=1656892 RepID=A0A849A8C4_9ACTN|nr:VOC family protein [Nakamurella aerolata]NNG36809.1 glyoxalase [Nakamurella aerolata]
MHQLIFVHLPVSDLPRSRRFFTALGYRFNDEFCDPERALCLVLGGNIYAMLLKPECYASFTRTGAGHAAVLAVSADSREHVDRLADAAIAAGGTEVRVQDQGFMYGRSYADPDGHVWELMWMDPLAAAGASARRSSTATA